MTQEAWDALEGLLASPSQTKEIKEIAKSLVGFVQKTGFTTGQKKAALEKCNRLMAIADSLDSLLGD